MAIVNHLPKMDETKYNKIIIKSNTKLANIITWFMFRLQFIIYISPFYRNSMKRKYVEWKTHQVWADIFSNVAITIISLAALIHPWPTVHHLHSRQPESCFDGSHNFLSFSPPFPPNPKRGGCLRGSGGFSSEADQTSSLVPAPDVRAGVGFRWSPASRRGKVRVTRRVKLEPL